MPIHLSLACMWLPSWDQPPSETCGMVSWCAHLSVSPCGTGCSWDLLLIACPCLGTCGVVSWPTACCSHSETCSITLVKGHLEWPLVSLASEWTDLNQSGYSTPSVGRGHSPRGPAVFADSLQPASRGRFHLIGLVVLLFHGFLWYQLWVASHPSPSIQPPP